MVISIVCVQNNTSIYSNHEKILKKNWQNNVHVFQIIMDNFSNNYENLVNWKKLSYFKFILKNFCYNFYTSQLEVTW